MIEAFQQDAAPRVDAALSGAREGDLAALQRATHSLKSTAANLGARRLQHLAVELEEAAAAGDRELIAALIPRLQPDFERAQAALQAVHTATEE
jgi:HPt (histidine-containing phosphotransfer) domain-containing protein